MYLIVSIYVQIQVTNLGKELIYNLGTACAHKNALKYVMYVQLQNANNDKNNSNEMAELLK